jgi:hypothetical protein
MIQRLFDRNIISLSGLYVKFGKIANGGKIQSMLTAERAHGRIFGPRFLRVKNEGRLPMKSRRLSTLVAILLGVQLMLGCAMSDKREGLPEGRKIRTVPFPVRHMEFEPIICTQEFEIVTLSGALKNIAPYPVTNVGAKLRIFFADDVPKKIVVIRTTPPTIMPGETGTFEMKAEVEAPVSHIEIHPLYNRE